MEALRLTVPTYLGNLTLAPADSCENPDFSDPNVPVLVCQVAGVRVILGSHDYADLTKPEIQIERRPNGWAIFLHPLGGSDASGIVFFLDDGRSFLLPGSDGAAETIQVIDDENDVSELDFPIPNLYLSNAKLTLKSSESDETALLRANTDPDPPKALPDSQIAPSLLALLAVHQVDKKTSNHTGEKK